MAKHTAFPLLAAFHLIAILTALSSCGQKEQRAAPMPESVHAYIYGYTSGIISKTSPVRIRLASQVAKAEQIGQAAPALLSFSPAVDGALIWESPSTLRFEPAAHFQSGTAYLARMDLGALFPGAPKDAQSFEFDFRTRDQWLQLDLSGFQSPDPSDLSQQQITGTAYAADEASLESVEEAVSAKQGRQSLPISWTAGAVPNSYQFTVQGVVRTAQRSEVILAWDGQPLGAEGSGRTQIEVPPLGEFRLAQARAQAQEEQAIVLNFSDPLNTAQDFTGMISLSGYNGSFRFLAQGNELRVYPSRPLSGQFRLTAEKAIQNSMGKPMSAAATWDLQIEQPRPEVRLVGQGVILPSSDGLAFPFEAKGLDAVEVEIFKIYHNNILQFLQDNTLSGQYDLRQVGRVIHQGKVPLQQLAPMGGSGSWTRYALDLSNLVAQDPQAIYQVRIGFRPGYASQPCATAAPTEKDALALPASSTREIQSIMDNWYGFDGYYEGFSWDDRDDPCKPAYYNADRFVARNVLASNIGLIAKINDAGACIAIASDLRTAAPLPGTAIEIYDYQQQLLSSGTTDSEGVFRTQVPRTPHVMVARSGEERGFLRLEDGDALSMSRFDVDGATAQQGLKGFLYGDRGVWRPGDSVFLHFILEDPQGQLPPRYPITFELYGPRGQLQLKRTEHESLQQLYPLHFQTPADAPTGIWRAVVKAGGAQFQKNLRIETVKPNRLKIELDFGGSRLQAQPGGFAPALTASWLHGAPAGNLKAVIEGELQPGRSDFDGFNGFAFEDPARKVSSAPATLFEGQLDGNGKATPRLQLNSNQALPGRLQAVFKTRVFENGGGFSSDNFSISYDPFPAYAGVRIPHNDAGSPQVEVGAAAPLTFAAVSAQGQPLPNRRLEVGLYRIEWRWWWDNGQDNVSRYNSGTHYGALEKATLTTGKDGKAVWETNVDQWGRYLVRVCDPETGHCAGDFFYAGYPWYGDEGEGYREEAAMISFTSDKKQYEVGQTITLNLPDVKAGRILLSLETGSQVLETRWLDARGGQQQLTFEATPEMAPTVYAHVTLLQPHQSAANDLPIRLYGVLPIRVEDPATRLQPVLAVDEVLRPQQPFTVKVSNTDKRPMAYTVAVVDEGLLSLTRFGTPDPWSHFFAPEALGIRTWDVYNEVLGAYGGQLGQMLGIGGDAAINPAAARKANRFKPVVLHAGPFELGKGERRSHEFVMPNYTGAVRVMVVATAPGAYGNAQKAVTVKQPLMVLPTAPRVLAPNESFTLPVQVFATEEKLKEVQLKLELLSPLLEAADRQQDLAFEKPGDQLATFQLKAKARAGLARLRVTATSGQEKASQEIELDIRNPNPYSTVVQAQSVPPGKSFTFSYEELGVAGTNELSLEVSSIPPIDLERRLSYLLRYPYGCLEQTVSGAYPQLYAGQLLDLSTAQQETAKTNVQAALERVKKFQTGSGGLAYWPGNNAVSPWASTYAGDFMLEAQEAGYPLPAGVLDSWVQYQAKAARLWSPESQEMGLYANGNGYLEQAYRLYTLAKAGAPDLASMNRLKAAKQLPATAQWQLALAYQLAGQQRVALALADGAATNVQPYRELSGTFGSSLRDKALIAECQLRLGKEEAAAALIREIAEQLSSQQWLSTQEISFALSAVARFAKSQQVGAPLAFRYQQDGQPTDAGSSKPIMLIQLKPASGPVKVSNAGTGILFARLISKGQPAQGAEENSASGLTAEVRYTDKQGNRLQPGALPQGTDFIAEVKLSHPAKGGRAYKELALDQIFPSGWEIVNTRMDGLSGAANSNYDYQDIRDDRVSTFFSLAPGSSATFRVQLNAAYQGRFYLPAVSCKAMYDEGIYAQKAGQWVEVTAPAMPYQ
ncbi:alpha-2-macroglobulin family protein [Phaeodactylibacter luteus]|uniref:Alpha-2-macroglobulin n=1 Tax=Phaeodactylibacter luteus TaxID=1564516 RepID=A0A5C6RJT8_9BACT|nr:MG2 domain-containing protein [Phaeodactylibacter luteus]TXB62686.1 alpha-2-macroglobulin [Phaeodactylibacter luteus]